METLPRRFGPFLLLERLGEGASSTVYLARLAGSSPGLLVIKALHRHLYDDKRIVARFRHEAAMAVRIDSPYLARAHALGAVDGQLYIAMEHISGAPLGALLRALAERDDRIPVADAIDIALDMLRGLGSLHDARDPETGDHLGFVHRDVAPKNVIITSGKRAVLVDLGVGKSNQQSWRTATGAVVGTPGYMAPEQLFGDLIDRRSDLYAVGVVLWEMLTLRRYVKKAPISDMLRLAAEARFVAPSRLRSEIPAALDSVLERALQRSPDARYSTASEFIAPLETVKRGADPEEEWAGMEDALAKTTIRPDPGLAAIAFEDDARLDVYPTVEIYASSDVFEAAPPEGAGPTVALPKPKPKPAAKSNTKWVVALAASAVVFTSIGIAVGTLWARRTNEASVAQEPPARAAPERIVAAPRVTPSAEAPEAPAPAEEAPATEPEEAKRPARRARRSVEVTAPEAEPTTTPRQRFDAAATAFLARARRVRRDEPARAAEVDLLIGDLTRERLSTDYDAALERLKVLERRLEALER